MTRTGLFVSVTLITSISGQVSYELPGCEARPEVARILHEEIDSTKFVRLKWSEQQATLDKVLSELTAKYPREIEPHLRAIGNARFLNSTARMTELRERYRANAEAHPDDPLALALAAKALYEFDTPASIRLAEAARARAPKFAYPASLLAQIYSEGLRADPEKFNQNLRAFLDLCPSTTDWRTMSLLAKVTDPALPASVVPELRKRLAQETDPIALLRYTDLWSLEFRTTPPAKHPELRKQVAEDLKRLETLNPQTDALYWHMLLRGYPQSGASAETIKAFEDRVLQAVPGRGVSYLIQERRWSKANQKPDSETDREAWHIYNAKLLKILAAWGKEFPSIDLGIERLRLMFDDDTLTEAAGVDALESLIAHQRAWNEPDPQDLLAEARLLIERKWRLTRALELLDEAFPLSLEVRKGTTSQDNANADRNLLLAWAEMGPIEVAKATLQAALLLNQPGAAKSVRAHLEKPLPAGFDNRDIQSAYWHARALLAELDRHQPDALTYFQRALTLRPEAPKFHQGKKSDPLLDDATSLWKRMGGTEAAFVEWTKAPGASASEGRWERSKLELPAFELTDLSGNTWRLKTLEGKAVLINVWATWCGPCQAELPEFQKLYDKVKDRSDVQVISFNVDSEPGLVAPFAKEKGFTFPVILAYGYSKRLLDLLSFPQNWILDQQGKWLWTQYGYRSDPDWISDTLKRLESARTR